MVKQRKGHKNIWDVQLPGVKKPAVVKVYPSIPLWCVTPLTLTRAQQLKAVDLVKKHKFG
jgi:hypothetical protein